MDSKKWIFVFTALSGAGGLACILQWAEIKPEDLWGWHVSLAVPHWLWLAFGILLFVLSIGLSAYGIYSRTQPRESIGAQKKPAWQKLQWANAERERLEGEVKRLEDLYAAAQGPHEITEEMRRSIEYQTN
jgi:hypothetical protein